jgi:glycerol-3-phosphate dehydrogenase subunit C
MPPRLDWSADETAGKGDAYAGIPTSGGDFARAVAVCINDRQCQLKGKGVMCPCSRVTDVARDPPGGRVALLKAALNGEFGADGFADPRLAEAMDRASPARGASVNAPIRWIWRRSR